MSHWGKKKGRSEEKDSFATAETISGLQICLILQGKVPDAEKSWGWKLPVSSVNVSLTTTNMPWDSAITVRHTVQAVFSELQKHVFYSKPGNPDRVSSTSLSGITYYRVLKAAEELVL